MKNWGEIQSISTGYRIFESVLNTSTTCVVYQNCKISHCKFYEIPYNGSQGRDVDFCAR